MSQPLTNQARAGLFWTRMMALLTSLYHWDLVRKYKNFETYYRRVRVQLSYNYKVADPCNSMPNNTMSM